MDWKYKLSKFCKTRDNDRKIFFKSFGVRKFVSEKLYKINKVFMTQKRKKKIKKIWPIIKTENWEMCIIRPYQIYSTTFWLGLKAIHRCTNVLTMITVMLLSSSCRHRKKRSGGLLH